MSRCTLVGAEAIDIARITGLQLRSGYHRSWEDSDISPEAVRATDHVYLDLTRLTPWDRWRVAWARIGAHYFINSRNDRRNQCRDSSSSVSYSCGRPLSF